MHLAMTKLTILADHQLEALSGGNGRRRGGSSSSFSSVFSMASYENILRQSNLATNVVVGGGRNSFAGVINEQSNLAFQSIAQLG